MSRLSQCATCDRGRWNCGHYTPEDDTECPHYLHYRVQEYEELMTVREFTFVSLSIVLVLAVLLYLIYVSEPYALILIAFEFVVLFIYWMIKRRKYKKQQEIMGARTASVMNEKGDNNDISVSRMTTRNLIQLALRKLGITYDFDENNAFRIIYQGEHLIIDAKDDNAWITIYDLWWYDAPLDDPDNLNLVQRAINEYNIERNAKLVFVFNDEEKKVDVHTILNAIFVEQIYNLEHLLLAYMDVVLSSHQQFYNIMEQLRRQAHSSQE